MRQIATKSKTINQTECETNDVLLGVEWKWSTIVWPQRIRSLMIRFFRCSFFFLFGLRNSDTRSQITKRKRKTATSFILCVFVRDFNTTRKRKNKKDGGQTFNAIYTSKIAIVVYVEL